MTQPSLRSAPGSGWLVRRDTALLFIDAEDPSGLLDAFEETVEGQEVVGLDTFVTDRKFDVPAFVCLSWTSEVSIMVFGDIEIRTDHPSLPMFTGAGSGTWVGRDILLTQEITLSVSCSEPDDRTDLQKGTVSAGGFSLVLSQSELDEDVTSPDGQITRAHLRTSMNHDGTETSSPDQSPNVAVLGQNNAATRPAFVSATPIVDDPDLEPNLAQNSEPDPENSALVATEPGGISETVATAAPLESPDDDPKPDLGVDPHPNQLTHSIPFESRTNSGSDLAAHQIGAHATRHRMPPTARPEHPTPFESARQSTNGDRSSGVDSPGGVADRTASHASTPAPESPRIDLPPPTVLARTHAPQQPSAHPVLPPTPGWKSRTNGPGRQIVRPLSQRSDRAVDSSSSARENVGHQNDMVDDIAELRDETAINDPVIDELEWNDLRLDEVDDDGPAGGQVEGEDLAGTIAAAMNSVDPNQTPLPPRLQRFANERVAERMLIDGRVCVLGHANPPEAEQCATCSAAIDPSALVHLLARPSLGTLVLDDGSELDLTHDLLLGRNPFNDDDPNRSKLERILVKGEKLSRVHVEVRLKGWDVQVTDCGTTNGTFLIKAPNTPPIELEPGVPQTVESGTVILIGTRSMTYYSQTI